MEHQKENTQVPKAVKYFGIFCFWLFVWFLGGGSITWLAAFNDNPTLMQYSVIAWASFPFTISANLMSKNNFTYRLVIVNSILWIVLTGWNWIA